MENIFEVFQESSS